ncbi:hypothetical protein, partial [Luteimonas sp. TWI1416]|uniref:hypothetical protein n=1 Tax=Luteimonas sp. TWI1416 TaxID=3136803 RepID=UPI003208BC2D
MADSPPRAIHGPLSAPPSRHNALRLEVRGFFERAILDQNRGQSAIAGSGLASWPRFTAAVPE